MFNDSFKSANFSCCRYCKERHVGCHATCEKYLEARGRLQDVNEKSRADVVMAGYNSSSYNTPRTIHNKISKIK